MKRPKFIRKLIINLKYSSALRNFLTLEVFHPKIFFILFFLILTLKKSQLVF